MFAALLLTTLLAASLSEEQAAQLPTESEAEELAGQGNHKAAIEAFRQRAAANPNDLAARIWIGRLHVQMGRPEVAEPVYRSVVWEDPSRVDVALPLGAILVKQRRLEEALYVLDRASGAQPKNPDVLEALGDLHMRLSNKTLGRSYLELAAAIRSDAEKPEDVTARASR